MAPTLLFAAFLSHILPAKDSSNEHHDSEDDHGDPERGSPSGSGTNQDEAFDGDNNEREEADQEIEDPYDDEEKREVDTVDAAEDNGNEGRPSQGRGVPLTTTNTMSSSSMHISRPLLPKWLVKVKDVLFASHDDRDEFVPNYRRLPIISGSLIPFSILLEIPGLTEHWYVRTQGNQTVESRPNPPLVIVSMSFSMALALLANVALVYRFLERRVKTSTIVCIIALTLHGTTHLLLLRHLFIFLNIFQIY